MVVYRNKVRYKKLELTGQIEEIIYQNELNSYTIAIFNTGDEILTIVGYLPFINVRGYIENYWQFCDS